MRDAIADVTTLVTENVNAEIAWRRMLRILLVVDTSPPLDRSLAHLPGSPTGWRDGGRWLDILIAMETANDKTSNGQQIRAMTWSCSRRKSISGGGALYIECGSAGDAPSLWCCRSRFRRRRDVHQPWTTGWQAKSTVCHIKADSNML